MRGEFWIVVLMVAGGIVAADAGATERPLALQDDRGGIPLRVAGPGEPLPPEPLPGVDPVDPAAIPAAAPAADSPSSPSAAPIRVAEMGEPIYYYEGQESLQLRMEQGLVTVEPPVGHAGEMVPMVGGEAPGREARFPLAEGDDVVGPGNLRYLIRGHETLVEMARAYGLGFNEITLANPQVDPWIPSPGLLVRLPFRWVLPEVGRRADVIINLPEMRLYHFRGSGVDTYPIGIGVEGWESPVGNGRVTGKKENPTWYPPASIRKEDPSWPAVVPPGEENPLGAHAIYLDLPGNYRIHGTNMPYGVGRRVSHGCIRLYPEDVAKFFERVPVGAKVSFIDQPVKVGWFGEALMLEVHPPLTKEGREEPDLSVLLRRALNTALERRPNQDVELDWGLIQQMLDEPDGIPRRISRGYLAQGPGAGSGTLALR